MKIKLSATKAQAEVINSPHRLKGVTASRRWGKSVMAALYAVTVALKKPGSRILYAAPSYSRAFSQMRMMRACVALDPFIRKWYAQFPARAEFHNGSVIEWRSLDAPELLRGEAFDLVLIDEAAFVPEFVYSAVLAPSVADRRGTICLLSTFQGQNWYWKLHSTICDGKVPDAKAWIFPAPTAPCFQGVTGRAELAKIEATLPPSVFRQEFMCEAVAGGSCVFSPERIDAIVAGAELEHPDPRRRYLISCDLGRTVDPSALVIIDDQGQVVKTRVFPLGTEHVIVAQTLSVLARTWRAQVVIDSTAGAGGGHDNYLRFYREKLGGNLREINWNQRSKQAMVDNLSLAIEQAKVRIPETCKELLGELRSYQYKIGRFSFIVQYGAPQGSHDDLCCALMMGCHALARQWIGGTIPDMSPG